MHKLPITLGILAWKSGPTLEESLRTQRENGLFEAVAETIILFQESTPADLRLARKFGLEAIALNRNLGIGRGFLRLADFTEQEFFLPLEHDWHLVESAAVTRARLQRGIDLLREGFDVVRLRHRWNPGYPQFCFSLIGRELSNFDEWSQLPAVHLLDSLHWLDPAETFPDKIQWIQDHFVTTSRWGNWTNNPCLFRREFYRETIRPFIGNGIDLEQRIARFWPRQGYRIAHGEGLFMHSDPRKYGA